MSTAEQVLLIILSTTLAVFLVLAISVAIMLMVLVRRLQTVASKAEEVADTAVEISQSVRKTVGSFSFFSVMRTVADLVLHLKK